MCSSLPGIFYSFSVYLLQKSHFHPLVLTILSLKAYVDCLFLSSASPVSEGPLFFLTFPRHRPLVLLIRLVLSWIRVWPHTEGTWLYCYYFIWVYLVLCFNLYCGCFNLFFNMWVCVCVGVLVICVLVFTVFCIACTVFLYCFIYVYLFLFVLSVLV